MWGAYYEEWVNGNRHPPGYFHRGKWAPQLSANLEESLLCSGEEEISRCDYTDDVATYLRGKVRSMGMMDQADYQYGLFRGDRWKDMLDARRQFHSLLFDWSDVLVDTSSMRLEDGAEGEHNDIAVDFDDLDLDRPATGRPSWSSNWPAIHGHTPLTYFKGEASGATRGAQCSLEAYGSDHDSGFAEQEEESTQPTRQTKRQVRSCTMSRFVSDIRRAEREVCTVSLSYQYLTCDTSS